MPTRFGRGSSHIRPWLVFLIGLVPTSVMLVSLTASLGVIHLAGLIGHFANPAHAEVQPAHRPGMADAEVEVLRAEFERTREAMLGWLAGMVVSSLFGSLAIALMVSRQLLSPLGQVPRAERGLQERDLAGQPSDPRGDELIHVFQSFSELTGLVRNNFKLLQQMDLRLEQGERNREELLSVFSHELRTPLNFITGFASLLEDEVGGPLTDEQHRYLDRLNLGTERLEFLVENLVRTTQIKLGSLRIRLEAVTYADLIDGVVDGMSHQAIEREVRIELAVEPDLTAYLDGSLIRQALLNLIDNAVKFSTEGETVWVRAYRDGLDVLTEVVDAGPGIEGKDLPLIFEPLRQLDMGTTREVGGAGLGLSVARALVEAHGGELGVHSQPGHGSCFWFRLPQDSEALADEIAA